uniref:Putative DNA recombination protein n=1 Tax=viral metagenome TaxID=1070528 RepID=A0A6M3IGB4_9ZZZZ
MPNKEALELLKKRETNIRAILPSYIDPERFIKSAQLAIYNNSELKYCTPESIVTAVYNAAELGLDFTPAKRQAYLIKFKDKAVFIPGYGGLIELACREGAAEMIDAHIVFANDDFKIQFGSDPKIHHIPSLEENPGEILGAYAIAFLANGRFKPEWMTLKELKKVRQASACPDSPAYKNWLDEMYRKAPIRRLFKTLQTSAPKLEKALEYDNQQYDLTLLDETQAGEYKKPPKDEKELAKNLKQKQAVGDAGAGKSGESPDGMAGNEAGGMVGTPSASPSPESIPDFATMEMRKLIAQSVASYKGGAMAFAKMLKRDFNLENITNIRYEDAIELMRRVGIADSVIKQFEPIKTE